MAKTMRRCLAMVFALVALALACATPALAQVDDSSTATIKLAGLKVDGDNVPTATFYKVVDVRFNTSTQSYDTPNYYWIESIGQALLNSGDSDLSAAVTVTSTNVGTFYAVSESFMENSDDSPAAQKVYDYVRKLIETGKVAPTAATQTAGSEGTVSYDASMGGYIISVTGGPTYVYKTYFETALPQQVEGSSGYSLVSSTPAEGATVKSSTPSVTKKVTNADRTDSLVDATSATVGDVVTYTLTLGVPAYASGATNTTFKVVDTPPTGISLLAYKLAVTANGTTIGDSAYTVTLGSDGTLTIDFTDGYSSINSYSELTITYTGTVTKDMTPGTAATNSAELTYATNPYGIPGETATAKDTATVYTYGFRIYKYDATSKAALSGATFVVMSNSTASTVDALEFEYDSTNNIYRYTGKTKTLDVSTTLDSLSDAYKVTTRSDGYVWIAGLDEGTYIYKEVVAPTGYSVPNGQSMATITAAMTNGLKNGKVSTSPVSANEAYTNVDVSNTKGTFNLPTTGGPGTVAITAVGVIVMAAGVFLLMRHRKQR